MSATERLVRDCGLPAELVGLVRETVGRTRLWESERREVARELIAHFSDGLAAGRSTGRLAADFGDPARAAELITLARRRMRPLAWRVGVQAARAGAAVAAPALAIYAASAVRLYSGAPVVPEAPAIEAGLTRATVRAGHDGPAETIDFAVAWPRDAATARALSDSLHRLLARALVEAAAGEANGATAILRSAMEVTSRLADSATLPGQLAALDAQADMFHTLASSLRRGQLRLRGRELEELRLGALEPRAEGGESGLSAVRPGLESLFDRVYADDGRLSGQGLRLLQTMMGKAEPGVLALALEPAYFAFPADRSEVEAEVDRLAALPGVDRLAEEVRALRSSAVRSLRYIPLALVLPHMVTALARVEAAREQLRAIH